LGTFSKIQKVAKNVKVLAFICLSIAGTFAPFSKMKKVAENARKLRL
jgi:hypothetical protein